MKRIIFLTGQPGVGKTTVLLKTIEELGKAGISVGGMISQEVREDGSRVGFRIIDLATKNEAWLAHVRQPKGPSIGKYRVCLEDLESVGVHAILNAHKNAEVTVIDEVGPMELYSQAFKEAVKEALESGRTVLGTIHYKARDPLITNIRKREDTTVIEVTQDNREELPKHISKEIFEQVRQSQRQK